MNVNILAVVKPHDYKRLNYRKLFIIKAYT